MPNPCITFTEQQLQRLSVADKGTGLLIVKGGLPSRSGLVTSIY